MSSPFLLLLVSCQGLPLSCFTVPLAEHFRRLSLWEDQHNFPVEGNCRFWKISMVFRLKVSVEGPRWPFLGLRRFATGGYRPISPVGRGAVALPRVSVRELDTWLHRRLRGTY